jgi:hypothetical protein
MIDLSSESLLSLADAAKLVPPARLGRPVSFQCVLRWVLEGSRAPDGRAVKLEALRVGGRWVTSREALQRFAEALTPQPDHNADAASTPRQGRRNQSPGPAGRWGRQRKASAMAAGKEGHRDA